MPSFDKIFQIVTRPCKIGVAKINHNLDKGYDPNKIKMGGRRAGDFFEVDRVTRSPEGLMELWDQDNNVVFLTHKNSLGTLEQVIPDKLG